MYLGVYVKNAKTRVSLLKTITNAVNAGFLPDVIV